MNTKYSEKISIFFMNENVVIFTARDEIYLVFAEKKVNFLFILYSAEIQKAQTNFSLVVSRSI